MQMATDIWSGVQVLEIALKFFCFPPHQKGLCGSPIPSAMRLSA